MDEDALEAMIRRQQQAQATTQPGAKAELVEGNESFEVYERPRPADEAAEAEPADAAPAEAVAEPTAAPVSAPPVSEPVPTPDPSVGHIAQPTSDYQARPRIFQPRSDDAPPAPVVTPQAAPPPAPLHAEQQAAAADAALAAADRPAGAWRVAIVQAQFHADITDEMAAMATRRADKHGAEVVAHVPVPGAFDTPLATKRLLARHDVDAVVVLGCVIQGETAHDELITHAAAQQLARLACDFDKPVALGISGPRMTVAQAEARIVMGRNAMDAAVAQLVALNA